MMNHLTNVSMKLLNRPLNLSLLIMIPALVAGVALAQPTSSEPSTSTPQSNKATALPISKDQAAELIARERAARTSSEQAQVRVWNVNPVFFSLPQAIGGRQIRYYGVLYAVALMGAYMLWQWQIMRSGRSRERAERFLMIAVAAVLVGARVGHCLFYDPSYYLSHPLEIIKFWEGGLASHGATITLLLTLVYYARTEDMTVRETFDRFAIGVSWAASIIRLGNLMNSEIVGRETTSAVGVKFPLHDLSNETICYGCDTPNAIATCVKVARGAKEYCVDLAEVPHRHPSQVYEFLMGMIIFVTLITVDRLMGREDRPVGLLGGLFLVLYFTGRFIVEEFKEYQALEASSSALTMGQYLSIPFVTIGLGMLFVAYRRHTTREA